MRTERGQSTVEYAVVIVVIIAALIAMQIYIKRGAMGKLKDATDQIGEQFNPVHADWTFNRNYNANRHENQHSNGLSVTNITDERQFRGGTENRTGNTKTLQTENLFE